MNKCEAICLLKAGGKLTHNLFGKNEYLYMTEDKIFDEYNSFIFDINNIFWTKCTDSRWNKGWKNFEALIPVIIK